MLWLTLFTMLMGGSPEALAQEKPHTAGRILDQLYQAHIGIKDLIMHVHQEVMAEPGKPPITTDLDVKMIVGGSTWVRSVTRGMPKVPEIVSETALQGSTIYTKSIDETGQPQYEKVDAARVPGINLEEMRRAPLQDPQIPGALAKLEEVAVLKGTATVAGVNCWVLEFEPTMEVIKTLAGLAQGKLDDRQAGEIAKLAGKFRLYVDQAANLLCRMEMLDKDGRAAMSVTMTGVKPNPGLTNKDCLIDAPAEKFRDTTDAVLKSAQPGARPGAAPAGQAPALPPPPRQGGALPNRY